MAGLFTVVIGSSPHPPAYGLAQHLCGATRRLVVHPEVWIAVRDEDRVARVTSNRRRRLDIDPQATWLRREQQRFGIARRRVLCEGIVNTTPPQLPKSSPRLLCPLARHPRIRRPISLRMDEPRTGLSMLHCALRAERVYGDWLDIDGTSASPLSGAGKRVLWRYAGSSEGPRRWKQARSERGSRHMTDGQPSGLSELLKVVDGRSST